MKFPASALILVFMLSVAAHGAGRPTAHVRNQVLVDEVVDGQFGPGALYRLVRPANWNGRLVLYAHGFVSRSEPVVLPSEADLIINLLTPQGFAVAFTSFSENGWAVKDGAQRTHQLLGIFTSKFGPPTGVYIAGASLGGLITIKLVEQYPSAFIGALPSVHGPGGYVAGQGSRPGNREHVPGKAAVLRFIAASDRAG